MFSTEARDPELTERDPLAKKKVKDDAPRDFLVTLDIDAHAPVRMRAFCCQRRRWQQADRRSIARLAERMVAYFGSNSPSIPALV